MEVEKRKRSDDDEKTDGEKKPKAREEDDGGQRVADDDEVEEFFAILRRIQVAVKYFEKANGGRKLTAKGSTLWSSSFELEEDGVLNGVNKGNKEGVEENPLLDLNAVPEP